LSPQSRGRGPGRDREIATPWKTCEGRGHARLLEPNARGTAHWAEFDSPEAGQRGLEPRFCGYWDFEGLYTRPWLGRMLRRRQPRSRGKRLTSWDKSRQADLPGSGA
jgi:hypothetical protein